MKNNVSTIEITVHGQGLQIKVDGNKTIIENAIAILLSENPEMLLSVMEKLEKAVDDTISEKEKK